MNNSLYKSILDNLEQIIIVKDINKNIIYINHEQNIDIEKEIINNNEIFYNNNFYKIKENKINIENEIFYLTVYEDITNHKMLIEKSSYDELTKLYNFGKTQEELLSCIEDANETGETFTVIMADIDDFKIINDSIGHIYSNDILVGVSNILKSNIRSYDIVGRFGGEEFLIILKKCSVDNAYKKVEQLRKLIEQLNVHNHKVTLSFGLDEYDKTKGMKDVLKNADEALYESKHNGKNTVTIYKNKNSY